MRGDGLDSQGHTQSRTVTRGSELGSRGHGLSPMGVGQVPEDRRGDAWR